MHPTERALLDAVLAAPDDDLPRLVLADWYEENGQPERANLIRAHIAVYRKQLVCSRDGFKNRQRGARPRDSSGRSQYWRKRCRCAACRWARLTFRGSEHDSSLRWRAEQIPGVVSSAERGFVYLIYTQVAKWCGGACFMCADPFAPFAPSDCQSCHGSGAIAAIGPRLVRDHPITYVHICDRFERHRHEGGVTVVVSRESAGVLFDIAFPSSGASAEGQEEDVIDALSSAAISWAKSQTPHLSATPVSADVTA